MASLEGEGDDPSSPGGEQDPGPGPQARGGSAEITQGTEGSGETDAQTGGGQARNEEIGGWMQHVRRRRRKRARRTGHLLDQEGNEPSWTCQHVQRPYSTLELRTAAFEAVAQPALQVLANLMIDRNVETHQVLSYVMAVRQRCQDLERGPRNLPGWRYWILTSTGPTWYMGFSTETLLTRTCAPDKVGADNVKLTATLGCQTGKRFRKTFSGPVWSPYQAGYREQQRLSREAEARHLRQQWSRPYRLIFDLIDTEKSLRHGWLHRLQNDEELFSFVRFMGVMSSCENQAMRTWFFRAIGTYKLTVPWSWQSTERSYHACRGLKQEDIRYQYAIGQSLGLEMFTSTDRPGDEAIGETSSEDDEEGRDSDSWMESSDEELPYIVPGMEPPRSRPVMFLCRSSRCVRPWPTRVSTHHLAVTTSEIPGNDSDEMEAHESTTPGQAGASVTPSAPPEPTQQRQAELPIITVHEPPREHPNGPSEGVSERAGRRRGACAVYDCDVIEVIDVESSDEEVTPPQKRQGTAVSTPGSMTSSSMPRPTQANEAQRQRKSKASRLERRQRAPVPTRTPTPSRFHELLRERLISRPLNYKPQSFWEICAGRDAATQPLEQSSHEQPMPERPPRVPSVFALPAVNTSGTRPTEETQESPLPPSTTQAESLAHEEPQTPLDSWSEYEEPPAPPTPHPVNEEPRAHQASAAEYLEPLRGHQSLQPGHVEPPDASAYYQEHWVPQAPPAPYQPREPQGPPTHGPWHTEPQYPAPWYPGDMYSPQWDPYPGYGYQPPPWDPYTGGARLPPLPYQGYQPARWGPYSGNPYPRPPQAPYPGYYDQVLTQRAPYRPPWAVRRRLPQDMPYTQSRLASAPLRQSAPLRPVPTRHPQPSSSLQDSMSASTEASGASYPSMLFASDYNQGAFTPLGTEGTEPTRPQLEEPPRSSEAAPAPTGDLETLSDSSDSISVVSGGQMTTKPTDYDASPESDLE
uniref:Nuclear antigen 3C n=1 Tax=Cercopithecine herpesvirus 12 TaxID=106332 RepID=Q80DL8_CHV12|nr:nuclear antigen 3C [Papiine gammaherpesvirus 1]